MSLSALVICSPGLAQPINYGDFVGANPGEVDFLQVTEDSATDPTPLYGAPTRVANTLFFFPTSWAATAVGTGAADTIATTLHVTIRADSGFILEQVEITETGEWQLTGVGTSTTSVNVSGSLFVTDLIPGTNGVFTVAGVSVPTFPIDLSGGASSGNWQQNSVVILSGIVVHEIQLQFNNTLAATSENQTTAFIQKNVIDGPSLEIRVIPRSVCCLGNAEKLANNVISFNDVIAVLANWDPNANFTNANGASVGDADCNGRVNTDDIMQVLGNWQLICP